MIDLHMHTIYSDGASRPDELVKHAVQFGLEAIAITDHDNTESLNPARESLAELIQETQNDPENSLYKRAPHFTLIPGIEINTSWKGHEVHVLGYFIDPDNSSLKTVIEKHKQARLDQIRQFARSLNQKAKIPIAYEDILKHANSEGCVGRPHIAQALVGMGAVHSIGDAFQKYLTSKAPTYCKRETVPPHEAVEAIYDSGGIPVIAHPGEMPIIEELATDLLDYGLRGLEAYHKSHSPAVIEFHCSLAEKLGLIVTGGTDFHGPGDSYPNSLQRFFMPESVYASLNRDHQNRQRRFIKAS